MFKYVLGDAVGGGEDVIVVDERTAAELAVAVHQGSLQTNRGRRHITVRLNAAIERLGLQHGVNSRGEGVT
jgi:hypothetical protein